MILNLQQETARSPERQRHILGEHPRLRATRGTAKDWLAKLASGD